MLYLLVICLLSLHLYDAFRINNFPAKRRQIIEAIKPKTSDVYESISVFIELGDGYKNIECKFRPLFQKSEFYTVNYAVPFNLNIDKPPKGFPAPIVSKDGEFGEKEGDVLRATTCWSQGFNAAGVTSDIAMFAGNIKWRKSVFETAGAPWQQVVDALLSNTEERSKVVTLVYEREIPNLTETETN
eukprot:gene4141-5895_t